MISYFLAHKLPIKAHGHEAHGPIALVNMIHLNQFTRHFSNQLITRVFPKNAGVNLIGAITNQSRKIIKILTFICTLGAAFAVPFISIMTRDVILSYLIRN